MNGWFLTTQVAICFLLYKCDPDFQHFHRIIEKTLAKHTRAVLNNVALAVVGIALTLLLAQKKRSWRQAGTLKGMVKSKHNRERRVIEMKWKYRHHIAERERDKRRDNIGETIR